MSDKASGSLPPDHPLFAPGLKTRARASGGAARIWVAPAHDVRSGFRPKSQSFPAVQTELAVAEGCRQLWAQVLAWRDCGAGMSKKAVSWRNKDCPPMPDMAAFDGEGGVYFLQCRGADNRIKIGYARDPAERLKTLATGCPFPLEMISFHKGPPSLEGYLHHHFRHDRIHGEWFLPSKNLLSCAHAPRAWIERKVVIAGTSVRLQEERQRNGPFEYWPKPLKMLVGDVGIEPTTS